MGRAVEELRGKSGAQGSEPRLARPAAEGEDTGRGGEGEARPLRFATPQLHVGVLALPHSAGEIAP